VDGRQPSIFYNGGMRRPLLLTTVVVLTLAGCSDAGPAPAPSTTSTASAPPTAAGPVVTLTVTSTAFVDGATIPAAFTCAGAGGVPPIAWSGNLRGTAAVAVVVDDPDAPSGTFVHRIVLDLPAATPSLGTDLPAGAHQALNSAGRTGWTPPCPPSGTHHYRFTVYGLNSATGLPDGVATADALAAINARATVQGRLTGLVSH
jgi:Raf kinase inhibitor-like YbhB/YbcL family protein